MGSPCSPEADYVSLVLVSISYLFVVYELFPIDSLLQPKN